MSTEDISVQNTFLGPKLTIEAHYTIDLTLYHRTRAQKASDEQLERTIKELEQVRRPGILSAVLTTLNERTEGEKNLPFVEHAREVWMAQQFSYAWDAIELDVHRTERAQRARAQQS